MDASVGRAIESTYAQGGFAAKRDWHRFSYSNAGLGRQGHRRVLDERRIYRFAAEEFQDPLDSIDGDECLWLGSAEAAAGSRYAALDVSERFARADFAHYLAQGLSVRQPGQGTVAPRLILILRRRDPKCPEPVVARVIQILHEGKASRLVEELDDPLA